LVVGILAALIYIALPVALIVGAVFIIHKVYVHLYFKSERFLQIKESINEHTRNCNDLNSHIDELKCSYSNKKTKEYGDSTIYDDSNFNMKRREWQKNIKSHQIHNCSASVCKNASDQPFKYLCKYFDIKTTEETLSEFEKVLNDFSAAEQGKMLLKNERDSILASISNSIPALIFRFSKEQLIAKLGFMPIDFSDLYFPVYTFQYVSAGGNSSMKCDIKFDVDNLDKFIRYLGELVKFRKSVAGQRALMTSGLRESIKNRDDFTCQICSLSIADEKNLLLEIDHIIPLSKGGVTSESNLQTLCWKCNRSKGSKLFLN
jgi:hypothetical protein